MFYLTTHSTHFIYGYMASDIWLRTILIVRKETRCRHIGYSFRLAARVLIYAPSHRQDSTCHGLCYTSRGALAGTRNSSMGPPHEVNDKQARRNDFGSVCVCVCVCVCIGGGGGAHWQIVGTSGLLNCIINCHINHVGTFHGNLVKKKTEEGVGGGGEKGHVPHPRLVSKSLIKKKISTSLPHLLSRLKIAYITNVASGLLDLSCDSSKQIAYALMLYSPLSN